MAAVFNGNTYAALDVFIAAAARDYFEIVVHITP